MTRGTAGEIQKRGTEGKWFDPSAILQRRLKIRITESWLLLVTLVENVTLWGGRGGSRGEGHILADNVLQSTIVSPLSGASDSYLVEVGGPVLSLRGLSFICELFVCSALHCDTALANLPNEPQELHNKKKKNNKQHLL